MIPTNMYKKISEELNKLGFTLISKKYKNVAKKMVIADSDGYMYYSSLSTIRKSKKLPFISNANPFTNRNLNLFFANKGLSSTPVSITKIGKYYSIEIICKCGIKYQAYWDNVSKERRMYQQYCPKCSKKIQSELHKLSDSIVLNEFKKRKIIPLFEHYKTSVTKYPCQDKSGYKDTITLQNVKSGVNITPFSPSNPFAIENISLFLLRNNVTSKVLSKTLGNFSKIPECSIDLLCECGERFRSKLVCVLQLVSVRCRKCSNDESGYERLTRQCLTDAGVRFEYEKKMPGCVYEQSLRFDFATLDKGEVTSLIEVDGEFHFDEYAHIFPKSYSGQKVRDAIKDAYCQENKIPLLRIPYWEYKNDNYKSIVLSFIKENGITNTA